MCKAALAIQIDGHLWNDMGEGAAQMQMQKRDTRLEEANGRVLFCSSECHSALLISRSWVPKRAAEGLAAK